MDIDVGEKTMEIGLPDDPASTCRLLEVLSVGEAARKYRYDTILIAAARMIQAFERAPLAFRRR